MAITKETEISKIEVVGEYKTVQVRTDTVIKEDGTEISRSFHRHTLECGTLADDNTLTDTDISGENSEVQAVCNAVWTTTVKNSYRDKLIADAS